MTQSKNFILALSSFLLSTNLSSLAYSGTDEVEINPSLNDHQDARHRLTKRNGGKAKKAGSGAGNSECTPSSIKGIWSHMSQGMEFGKSIDNGNDGAYRLWIVTCPETTFNNGDVTWGDGKCQIADVNANTPPEAGGCGFLGILEQKHMYVNENGKCAFTRVDFLAKGCEMDLSFKAEQDSEDLWLLRFSFYKNETYVNENNPRHTTRNHWR